MFAGLAYNRQPFAGLPYSRQAFAGQRAILHSPMQTVVEKGERVEAPADTSASPFTRTTCAGSALGMGEETVLDAWGHRAVSSLSPLQRGQMMGAYFLVETRVADLEPGDWVMEPTHGGRRITTIKRYINSSYLSFDEGPSNWYLDVETLPCERLS